MLGDARQGAQEHGGGTYADAGGRVGESVVEGVDGVPSGGGEGGDGLGEEGAAGGPYVGFEGGVLAPSADGASASADLLAGPVGGHAAGEAQHRTAALV
ncbi:hypothetical protein J1792_31570 [Streptomyces triculaminicus]|uniref:Uncharacterized protein n=2 Tax=Streptomyces TaxID=1883 RepID=A0A939JUT6_9ACTN|nr:MULTISPECIES: hypothetical protein [Streptomyces]MBO0657104.1 hypothetical protein [Streptomyces triculaminicus]QSY49508.1 hypothetical protein J3S04_32215 [Streptomyces griseocarneus]